MRRGFILLYDACGQLEAVNRGLRRLVTTTYDEGPKTQPIVMRVRNYRPGSRQQGIPVALFRRYCCPSYILEAQYRVAARRGG